MNFRPIPTPPELFRQFEAGEMSREELQAAMAIHARGLIDEMLEERKNPITAYLERTRNRAAARRWRQRIGVVRLREVLEALAFIEAFPPAQILWNAGHMDVPLHCFFRTKHEPIFRIKHIEIEPMRVLVRLEYSKASKEEIKREEIVLRRDSKLRLELGTRKEV